MPPIISSSANQQRGFSLVELSIVLVILGLLVGGILGGQALIRASELRSVTTEVSGFNTNINAFRNKYLAVPGDMTNAYSFWGGNCAASAALCNGNGDGAIFSPSADGFKEHYQAWNHLQLAGLQEGTFTGANDASGNCSFGVNVPRSKLGNAGYIIYSSNFDTDHDYYQFGGNTGVLYGSCADHAVLTAEDAWGIDMKMDDGKPKQGTVHGENGGAGVPTVCYDVNDEYNLSGSGMGCRMYFRMAK